MVYKNFKLRRFKASKCSLTRCKKIWSLHFKCKYLAIYLVIVLKISFTHFYATLLQDPIIRYKKNKLKLYILCNRKGSFGFLVFDEKRPWNFRSYKHLYFHFFEYLGLNPSKDIASKKWSMGDLLDHYRNEEYIYWSKNQIIFSKFLGEGCYYVSIGV